MRAAMFVLVCVGAAALSIEILRAPVPPKHATLIAGLEWDRWLSFLDTADSAFVTIDHEHFPPHIWDEVLSLCAERDYECQLHRDTSGVYVSNAKTRVAFEHVSIRNKNTEKWRRATRSARTFWNF